MILITYISKTVVGGLNRVSSIGYLGNTKYHKFFNAPSERHGICSEVRHDNQAITTHHDH